MRICVENGTFTVAFLREGMAKVGWPLHLSRKNVKSPSLHVVPRLDRRPAQDSLGCLSEYGCTYRVPECHGRVSYRGGVEGTLLQGLYYDVVEDTVRNLEPMSPAVLFF